MDKAQLMLAILTVVTPTVTVFVALIVQRRDMRDLRNDLRKQMIDLRNDVRAYLLLLHERVAKVEARQGS